MITLEDYLEALKRWEPIAKARDREYIISEVISALALVVPVCLTAWINWLLLFATAHFFCA